MDIKTAATALLIIAAAVTILGWLKASADAYGKDKDNGKK